MLGHWLCPGVSELHSDLQNEGDNTHHTNEGGLTLDTCKLSGVMKLAKKKHLDDALY